MGCMRDVRVRTQRTDAMFEPLVETVAVLQKYGIQVGKIFSTFSDYVPRYAVAE